MLTHPNLMLFSMLFTVRLRLLAIITALIFTNLSANAQLLVDPNYPLPALINQTMLGFGANITNVTFTGSNQSIGYFNGINTNLGLDSGIVMSTGRVVDAIGPNNSETVGDDLGLPGDPQLNIISGNTTQDAAALTLDFTAVGDTFSFQFVFGSEEYIEFANSNFNDAFAFLITGPMPGGGNYNNTNIALLPGTTTPVTINNVNNIVNSQYFVDNAGGQSIQYDGFTTVLEATAGVIPDSTYSLKIVIADVFDGAYDSGVFLQKNCAYEPDSLEVRLGTPIEINCYDTMVTLGFNQAIDCNSLAADGSDFILLDDAYNQVSGVIVGESSASCDSGYGVSFLVDVQITPGQLPWGDYYLVPATGTDGNSIYSACDINVSVQQDTIPFSVLPPFSLVIEPNDTLSISCADSVITINFNQLIDCASLASDGSDFLLVDESFNEVDTAILGAVGPGCQSGVAAGSVEVNIQSGRLNWGTFYLITQEGTDGNSIYSICDETILVTPDTIVIVVTDYCYNINPDLLNVTVLDNDSIGVLWDVPVDPDLGYEWQEIFESYEVYRAIDPLGPFVLHGTTTSPNDTFYFDNTTAVDTQAYTYRVAVRYVDNNKSADSDSIQSILLNEDPNIAIDTTKLFLTWTEYWGWSNPTYNIWEQHDDNAWTLVTTTSSTEYEYSRNLTVEGTYKVMVETVENPMDSLPRARSNWIEYETIIYDPVISNVMTPNGDNKNDNFLIRNLHQHPNTKLMVYNRWGKKVYETEDYQNDWDGEKLKGGTYYYVVEFRGSIPGIEKGHIQIIK